MLASRLGRNYDKLWLASAVSNLGDGVRLTALPLLAASITRDPGAVAGVSLAGGLPWLFFALLAGAVVDRVDRRRLMSGMQVLRMAIMAALAATIVGGMESMPVLYIVAFALGVGEVLFDNAAQASMPMVVPRTELEAANGRLYAAEIVTNSFGGPPLGGFLFVAAAASPFAFDAATFALGAALIYSMAGRFRVEREPEATPTTIWVDIKEGLVWLWRHRLIRTLALMLGTMMLSYTATLSVFVLFSLEILGVGGAGFGVLLAMSTVGSVLATVTTRRITRAIGDAAALYAAVAVLAAAPGVIALTSSPIAVGAMGVLEGFGAVLWNIITVSMRQAIIPERLLGRVNSVYRLIGWGTMPVGAATGGVLAGVFGLRGPFVVAAVVTAVMGVAALPAVNRRTIAAARAAAAS